ncbi:MAG: antitoxin YefM [Verrucomicrobiales bacterium]
MKTVTATEARSDLYRLIDSSREAHEPIQITGKRGDVVLLSLEDFSAMEETIYLLNIKGMRESIIEGMATSVENCAEEIEL